MNKIKSVKLGYRIMIMWNWYELMDEEGIKKSTIRNALLNNWIHLDAPVYSLSI